MKIKPAAFDLALAKKQMSIEALIAATKTSSATIQKARKGEDVQPRTVGRVAAALGLDPADIIADEKEQPTPCKK